MDKNHMIISIDAEINLWQNSTALHGESSVKKLGIEETHFNILKPIYNKPISKCILINGGKW
jgi:hypothetical protein